MKNYYRIMLGKKSIHAEKCYEGKFIGADFKIDVDLTGKLPENWREFNQKFIPLYLQKHPDKSKIAAGLACGTLWTIAKGIQKGDIVLCPNGKGSYYVGEVMGDYSYHPEEILLVDDQQGYVHPEQEALWIPIPEFLPPYSDGDDALEQVWSDIQSRIKHS